MWSTFLSIDLGFLVDATARATVLLILACGGTLWLRKESAALRHRIWALALVGMMALPLASWLVPGWSIPVLPERSRSMPAAEPVAIASPAPPTPEPAAPIPVPAPAEPKTFIPRTVTTARPVAVKPTPLPILDLADVRPMVPSWLAIWAVGAIAAMLPVVVGLLGNIRLRRRSRPLIDPKWRDLCDELCRVLSIRRRVELRRDDRASIPLTWGIIRPLILLPDDSETWPDAKRRLVLLHELAHIQRFDAALLLLGRLSASLYWFHPLAWYALRQLRLEAEHACDDGVVAAGERASDYAGQLVAMARSARLPRFTMTIAMARANALERRLTAMFDETTSHRPLDQRAGHRLLASAFALLIGLAMVHPGAPVAPASTVDPAPSVTDEPPAKGTGRIEGRVVGIGGKAAGNAQMILLDPPRKGENMYVWPLRMRPTKTGADGRFAFNELAPGKYRVWANRGNLTSRSRRLQGETVNIPESGPSPKPIELRLHRAVRVTVKIVEKSSGKPIPGATVHPGWSDFIDDFKAGPDGRVEAQPFTAERWQINVFADGFAKQSRWLNLANGEDAEATFQLEPGGDIEGIVRDDNGKPVAGVGVAAVLEDQFQQFDYMKSDANGRYRLRHLPLNVGVRIEQSKHGGTYLRESVTTRLTGPNQTLDLTLHRRPHGGTIAGVVRDRDGKPIAGALLHNPSNSSSEFRESKSGPDGRFVLDDLYESSTGKEVIATAPGFAPARLKVEPGPAGKPAEVTITMEPGHRIQGLVTDDRGKPIAGVRVYYGGAYHGHSGGGLADTDKQGRFAFDSLPPECLFAFVKNGYSVIDDRPLPLDTGEVVTVKLVPAGVVAGRVVDGRTGKPVRSFRVRVGHSTRRRPEDPSGGIRTDLIEPGQIFQSDQGEFRVGDMILGMPLQATVSADGYERSIVERVVAARPDAVSAEVFRLEPIDMANVRAYRGRLRDHRGQPVVGAHVRLIAARDRAPNNRGNYPFNWSMIHNGQLAQQPRVVRFLQATTDAKGVFQFDGVPRGTDVELAWWGKGIANGRADHLENVAEDREGWFDLTLPMSSRIVVTVDRESYPTAASIQLSGDMALIDYNSITFKPGQAEYAFEDLPPGEYSVLLMSALELIPGKPGSYTNETVATRKVTLETGVTATVDFKP